MLTRATLSTIHDDLFPTPTSTQDVPPKHALPGKLRDYRRTTAKEALLYIHFETEGFIGPKSAFLLKETNRAANRVL